MNFTYSLAYGSAISLLILGSSVTATSLHNKEGVSNVVKANSLTKGGYLANNLFSKPVFSSQYCIAEEDKALKCFHTQADLDFEIDSMLAADQAFLSGEISQSEKAERQKPPIRALLYEHANYRGWVYPIRQTFCIGRGNLPGKFNDNISSLKVFGCSIILYEHDINDPKFLTGVIRTYTRNTSYVGRFMNDKASYWNLGRRL